MDCATNIITLQNFDRIMDMAGPDSPLHCFLNLEYLPHGKINSVPADETPYRRNLPGNGVCFVFWDENTPGLEARAKGLVDELSSMVKVPGMHYGNFSESSCTVFDAMSVLAYAPQQGADTEALPSPEGVVKPVRAKELFREHYPRLQEIKKKYDPDMMFNKWFVVHPAPA